MALFSLNRTMLSEDQIIERLRNVKYPGYSRDIVSFGLVQGIHVDGNFVQLKLRVATDNPEIPQQIQNEIAANLKEAGVEVEIETELVSPSQVSKAVEAMPIDGVKRVIAVASGKGGVGKSTVSANLALSLHELGYKTGLCDCDLYGPSMGVMFGVDEAPFADEHDRIVPIERFGLKLMSMGFMLSEGAPAVLRGPMATRYCQQLLRNTAWGELDFMVIDLPPGTGDIPLTIAQTVKMDGVVVVTTPQEVSLIDVRKSIGMFDRVNTRILGIVENMSYFVCPSDGKQYHIFGEGGGKREAERINVPFLGSIPLDMETRAAGDEGQPIVSRDKNSAVTKSFLEAGKKLLEILK